MNDCVAAVERALLGTLLMAPYLLKHCSSLTPTDFSDELRGRVFAEIVELGEMADAPLVAAQLCEKGVRPPRGSGWFEAISRLLDEYCVMDESVCRYVSIAREAAIERKIAGRRSGK